MNILSMSFKFESCIIDLLLNPTIQDDFQSCRLESLLLRHMNRVNLDTVEDVLQILHKCVARVERLRDLKIRYQ